MKIVRNLGDRYKLLNGYRTVDLIHKALKEIDGKGLSDEQQRDLRQAFGDIGSRGNLNMPFIAYSWHERKGTRNPIWRLTFPLLALYVVFLILFVLPVKWLLTGKFYFSGNDNWFTRFNMAWYNKVFDRKWYE